MAPSNVHRALLPALQPWQTTMAPQWPLALPKLALNNIYHAPS